MYARAKAHFCVLADSIRILPSITQDTFSFALVLLCLAVGDIAFVRNRGRGIARTGYASGFRPRIPKPLRKACPEIAVLIEEMWLTDFRARPAMKDVVLRLEAAATFGTVEELNAAPLEIIASEIGDTPSTTLLESFSGVTPEEHAAVRRLAVASEHLLREQPAYVRGEVALLRIVRYTVPDMEYIHRMLDVRRALGSDAMAHELWEGGFTLHTLPGAERLLAATLQTNEWVGLDTQGDLVMYERWGAINPTKMLAELTVKQYSEWNAYRFEARAMVLDALSRRARRVVRFAIVINLEGTGLGHRKTIPYIKEFSGGDSVWVAPDVGSTAHVVCCGKVAASIYALADRMGLFSAAIQATTFLIAGTDPFAASSDFAASFDRSAMPSDIGGELVTGTDGHCCLGIEQPALCDEDAIWANYLLMLTSS